MTLSAGAIRELCHVAGKTVLRRAGTVRHVITLASRINERSAALFYRKLDAADGTQFDVLISSCGGNVACGLEIFNALATHPARKIVHIAGLAASMASVISMAGDEVRMLAGARIMIHHPGGAKYDTLNDATRARTNAMIATYARTGLPRERIIELMDAETWMDADEAVRLGFADLIVDAVPIGVADVARVMPRLIAVTGRRR